MVDKYYKITLNRIIESNGEVKLKTIWSKHFPEDEFAFLIAVADPFFKLYLTNKLNIQIQEGL